jgi:transcriptional regulator with XRE-family HTH domain
MITGRQIRAARSLLEWKAEDLARAAGLTRVTVSNLEAGSVQPQEKTIASIVAAFDKHGIEFTDGEGVKVRQNEVRVFSGRMGHKQFLDHVYFILKESGGGRIRQFNLSGRSTSPICRRF